MAEQVPSIGRVVHFVATNGAHVPADICAVNVSVEVFGGPDLAQHRVDLFVKDSTMRRAYFEYGVPMEATGHAVGSWHWPEYVPAK